MNRAQVIERLKLSRLVEAELPQRDGGVRVFLEVQPMIDQARSTFQVSTHGGEPRLLRLNPNADVIQEYKVRQCALLPGWEATPDDWDRFVHEQVKLTVASLDELERYLSEGHGVDLESLKVPGSTDSPL